eukprot:COSAG03_NODE_1462_length_4041_cov_21.566971_3_plen_104_part_00
MASKVSHYQKGATNSAAYWWQQKKNLSTAIARRHFESDEMPALFFTGSYAEYHWPEVRRVLATAAREDGDAGLLADIEGGKVHLAIRRYEALLNELLGRALWG